jgi:hypothetical protein
MLFFFCSRTFAIALLLGHSPQGATMRNIVFVAAGLIAIGSSPTLIGRAHAQTAPQMDFVPGELIVGYYTDQDVQDAKQKIANAADDVRVRGNRPAGIRVEEHGGASLVSNFRIASDKRREAIRPRSWPCSKSWRSK